MDLDTFKDEKAKLSAALEKHSRTMLVEEFKSFFQDFPEVEALSWNQYTPYFNDGDVCEFSRHSFDVKGKIADELRKDASANDDDGEFYDEYSLNRGGKLYTALRKLEKNFSETDDVFKAAFGDGVKVICTRNGFEIEEYDHD